MLREVKEGLMLLFKVDGMTCDGCVRSVTQAVHRVAPAVKVSVNLASGEVAVEGSANPARLREAITDAGFEVQTS
jgi:copper chaperone